MKIIGKISIILTIVFFVSLTICILTGPIQIFTGFESVSINQFERESLSGIEVVEVSVPDADVNIYPITGDEFDIALTGYYAKNEYGGNVNLSVEKAVNILNIKIIYPNNRIIIINRDFNLDIGVPENYSGEIIVFSASGNIKISDFDLENLEAKTLSGEIEIENINNSRDSLIKSASGDIDIKNLNSENIKIESISGETEGNYIKSENEFYSETSSGNIEINYLETNKGNFESISGGITLRNSKNINSVKTTSGKIEIEGYEINENLNLKTVSGDINLDLTENSSVNIIFKSVSGDLDNSFGEIEDGNNLINVKTTSGDFRVY